MPSSSHDLIPFAKHEERRDNKVGLGGGARRLERRACLHTLQLVVVIEESGDVELRGTKNRPSTKNVVCKPP